jgi:single-strand DNA-binding protein
MFDTYVTIVGNVLTLPEWRRTAQSGALVTTFKVASTARRLDRDTRRWVDGNSLRVRVNCWRRLAEGVAASVMVGDPVVVFGRMYTRDWIDDAGNHRTLYELEAIAVGHDLSRGRARFARNRPSPATSEVADAEAAARVRGEQTESVSTAEAPVRRDARPFAHENEFDEIEFSREFGDDRPSMPPAAGEPGPGTPPAGVEAPAAGADPAGVISAGDGKTGGDGADRGVSGEPL